MSCPRRSSRGFWQSSVCIRRWGAAGDQRWRYRPMLFKPDVDEAAKTRDGARVASRGRRRAVSVLVTLLILGGLGYLGWMSLQQKQAANNRARPDLPVPVLAAT